MAREILMPKLGLTMTEGNLAKWYVSEGDPVNIGDKLLMVETDKLTNEVIADQEGFLIKKYVEEGITVPVKAVLGIIGEKDEKIVAKTAPAQEKDEVEASEKTVSEKEALPVKRTVTNDYIRATPYAKELAKERSIDLSSISPSGYDDVIVAQDILKQKAQAVTPLAAKMAAEQGIDISSLGVEGRVYSTDIPVVSNVGGAEDRTEKISTIRRIIADNLGSTWTETPMVTFQTKVNATELVNLRDRMKPIFEKQGKKLSYTHLLVLAVSKVLKRHPAINASYNEETITYHGDVNIGIAVDIGNGLLVPNIKQAHLKGLSEIIDHTDQLISLSKEGGLSPDDLAGGTFTITNLGMYSVDEFTPIINRPEVAILGVGRMYQTPVIKDGEVVPAPIMTLSLTADHALVDGATAARFMTDLEQVLEDPSLLLM